MEPKSILTRRDKNAQNPLIPHAHTGSFVVPSHNQFEIENKISS